MSSSFSAPKDMERCIQTQGEVVVTQKHSMRGNINDWSKGPASDVLTALDKTLPKAG
jgi:hypothetical protein